MAARSLRDTGRRVLGTLRVRARPRLSLELLDAAEVGGRVLLRLVIETPVEATVRDARVVLRRSLTVYQVSGEALGWAPRHRRTVLASETFSRIGRLPAGGRHEEVSWFGLPPGTPPSGVARRLHAVYRVSARVRFDDAPAGRRWIGVRVVSPRSLNAAAEAGTRVSGAPVADRLQVLPERRHARPGDRLCGRVLVDPPSDGVTCPVAVELRRREEGSRRYRTDMAFVREWTVERHLLSEGVTGPGSASLPFEVTVPRTACPTVEAEGTAVRWLVRAVLQDRRHRGDTAAAEINVHTGRDDRTPSA
jgi:hypothetical protein